MKRSFLVIAASLVAAVGLAQRNSSKYVHSEKFGGYVIGRYQTGEDTQDKGFDIRMLRLYVNGSAFGQLSYQLQIEGSGFPGSATGIRLIDAKVEWNKYKEFRIVAGQMHRPFSFENPVNPVEIGFGSNAQVISKLVGMSDRVGEHSSGGRDLGIQLRGDLLPIQDYRLLSYQIGLFNGQGINKTEDPNAAEHANHNKDVIGGLIVNPLKDLHLGVFGWTGQYYNASMLTSYHRNRMAYGIDYEGDYMFRAEYISSEGEGPNLGDKADGWYVAAGMPVGEKLRLNAKWDVYRNEKSSASQTSMYCLTGDYWFCKNCHLQLNYYYTEKGAAVGGLNHFNTLDLQLYVRF